MDEVTSETYFSHNKTLEKVTRSWLVKYSAVQVQDMQIPTTCGVSKVVEVS